LYDMQISALLNISPQFANSEIDTPLPSDEQIWDSCGRADLIDTILALQPCVNFREVMANLLSRGELMDGCGSFGISVVAHTLFRSVGICCRLISRFEKC
jgi:hypothetical protein